jgi:pimeloyl-ACP methyl ester carboxylesterase
MNRSTSCRKRIHNTAIAIFAFALSLGLIVSSHAQSYRSKGDRKKLDRVRPAARQESNATRGERDAIRPFRVHVPEKEITDLRRRIRETRWPDKETVADRSQGAQLAKLQELVRYWGSDYDWRKAEAKLNALPQFVTNIDGVDIHYIHVRSKIPNALPVLITHGWPGSVFEFLGTIGPLTDPVAHGGSAADAFDVVIPSIPGYGFSGRPTDTGWGPERIARAWAELMRRLGYTRYVAQGGDWGAPISSELARLMPPGLLGIHKQIVDFWEKKVRESPVVEGSGRAVRDAHAKTFGVVKAEVQILRNVPPAYAQGIYAKPDRHGALIRFSSASSEIDSKNPTVLVVEDNEDTRYFMRLGLEDRGYRVCEAANGEQAISVAYREQPDAILMDISMPILYGFTATSRIREHIKHITHFSTGSIILLIELKGRIISCGFAFRKALRHDTRT